MHPSSPHAPARLAAAGITTTRPTGFRAKGSAGSFVRTATDPLDALSKELHGKVVSGTAVARAHVAADELTLRRPRRPSAQRASYRTPPSSR